MRGWCSLGTAQRALEVGIADLELIIVLRVRLELLGFYLCSVELLTPYSSLTELGLLKVVPTLSV